MCCGVETLCIFVCNKCGEIICHLLSDVSNMLHKSVLKINDWITSEHNAYSSFDHTYDDYIELIKMISIYIYSK